MQKKIEGYDCMDCNIEFIFNECGYEDYRPVFIDSFRLFYNDIDSIETIGARLSQNRDNRFKSLYNYYGINTCQYINPNISKMLFWKIKPYNWEKKVFDDILPIISLSLKKSVPVSLEIDPYYLPWDKGYQKYHGKHACVITSFDGIRFLIVDVWYGKTGELSLDQVREGFVRVVIFDLLDKNKKKYVYNNSILGCMIGKVKKTNVLESIKKLGDGLTTIDVQKEFEGCTPMTYFEAPLDSRLLHTWEQRLQVSYFFDYLDEISVDGQMKKCAMLMRKSANLWRKIKDELVKMFITKKYESLEMLTQSISEIYTAEAEVIRICEDIYKREENNEDKVDLHIHSSNSDGVYDIETIFRLAREKEIKLLAITDHNYINNKGELEEYSAQYNVNYVMGVEITSIKNGKIVHILAYNWIDEESIKKYCEQIRDKEKQKDEKIISILQEEYKDISLFEYRDYVPTISGGWKLLNYLLEKKICCDGFEYFKLMDRKEFNDIEIYPDISEVIRLIHSCGAKAILAHPGATFADDDVEKNIKEIILMGIDGIECYHPLNSVYSTSMGINYCLNLGLFMTGGSDEHGNLEDRQMGVPVIKKVDVDFEFVK